MSQKNQNIQPSTPTQPPSQEKLPFWKASLVKALRGTIGVLETTAVKLETEPLPGSEEKPGFLQKIQQVWIGILAKLRLILPAKFSAKLSDTALTGIIGGLAVMVFLITSNLFGSKPPQVATVTPDTEIPPVISTTDINAIATEETPSIVETQENPNQEETITEQQEIPPQEITLPPEEETVSKQQEETTLPPEEETVSKQEEITLPSEQEIISKQEEETTLPSEEEIISKQEEIPPQLETTPEAIPLTPEETLIAGIQNQLGNIGDRTFPGIVESIQANFLGSNLTIKISNDWYSLEKKQQNELAAKIQQRSQELDFTHLEITDLQGKLIARNPVIGTEMIIFKR
ncbi:MAG: hypothetical protein WBA41_10745 [Rivularia sp. (in: cyanobacteria)]